MLDERSGGEDVSVLKVPEVREVERIRCFQEDEPDTHGSTP